MSSFFSGNHTFFGTYTFFGTMCGSKKVWVPFFLELLFLEPYFFWHNVWPEKSMSSFFLELILLLAQCSARTNMMFLLELILFFGTHIFFLAQCLAWKSMNSFFFWNPYFFVTMLGPKKYESECPCFCNSYFFLHFFWHPYFLWHNFWPEKIEIFFWTRTFFGAMFGPEKWNFLFVGTHTFFGRMFGLNMYEVAFFPGTLSFLKCYVLMK